MKKIIFCIACSFLLVTTSVYAQQKSRLEILDEKIAALEHRAERMAALQEQHEKRNEKKQLEKSNKALPPKKDFSVQLEKIEEQLERLKQERNLLLESNSKK